MGAIAIIGAGGFVGTRLVESLVLDGERDVRPIVRAYRNFASLSRFGSAISVRLADAEDPASLRREIQDCSTVVNLTTGTPAGIIRSTKAIYDACAATQVRRLVHMSSQVVYGEVVSPQIGDDSDPDTRSWMPYARAKAISEVWIRERLSSASFQVAVLRPGLVWGVRSAHTLNFAKALLSKTAFLVGGGKGIFNSIYVDNLVACIRACHDHVGDINGFYNVADRETLTWRDFYSAFAAHLGCDIERIPDVPADRFPWSISAAIDYVTSLPMMSDLYHYMKARLPDNAKARIKAMLAGRYNYEPVAREYATKPAVDRELWSLQRVRHKLPGQKFERHFGFVPPLSFADGARKTIIWLTALGYIPAALAVN